MTNPEISIVVCTYNRAAMLRDAIGSLIALKTDGLFRYEILVVDNASTDTTADVVVEISENADVVVRRVLEKRQGIVPARNRGVVEANGTWIAFFDDDQLADEAWLVQLWETAHKKNVRCVGGAVHLKLPVGQTRKLAPVCRVLLGETVGMKSERSYNQRVTPGTGNLMIRADVFREIGIFNPAFQQRGEDTDLFLRMFHAGIVGWFTPAAIVHHVIPAERLQPEYLARLSRLLVEGLAEDERTNWGGWLYPLIWMARVAQAGSLFVPRFVWAWICRDRERLLGAKCRLSIAYRYLRDGWFLMMPGMFR